MMFRRRTATRTAGTATLNRGLDVVRDDSDDDHYSKLWRKRSSSSSSRRLLLMMTPFRAVLAAFVVLVGARSMVIRLGLGSSSFSSFRSNTTENNKEYYRRGTRVLPRMVQYHPDESQIVTLVLPGVEGPENAEPAIDYRKNIITALNDDEEEEEDVCQPMDEWQSKNYIVCNNLHQFDMIQEAENGALEFINCGGDRCAFRIQDIQGRVLVLKTPKFRRPFKERTFDSARKDGMAMERLSASHYVLSTYGYCGISQIIEYGSGGNVHDLVKRARLEEHATLPDPIDRLKVAIQLVTAVADMHEKGITHNDLCCHQFIHVDGVYKLNDFHLSKFLRRNTQTHDICHERVMIGSGWLLIHSPEEILHNHVDTKMADVYVIGNVIYYVLTSKWIMEDEPAETRGNRTDFLAQGKRSPWPANIEQSTHPADDALKRAITMCWTQDVSKRPTAREVSNFLHEQLRYLSGATTKAAAGINLLPTKVSIPALPDDWDYSDRDFNDNFY